MDRSYFHFSFGFIDFRQSFPLFFFVIILSRIFFVWIHSNRLFKNKFEIASITVCKIYNKSCNVDMSINLFIRNLTLIGRFGEKKIHPK